MFERRYALVTIVVLAVCAAAQADVIDFNAPITVSQEVPAPTIPYTDDIEPSGAAFVTYDTDTNLLSWEINYAGLTGPIAGPGAHFHGPADFGETAGVQVTITTGGEPRSGVLEGDATLTENQEGQLLSGLWYINIHTELNLPGEIRGQVLPGEVPEPSVIALLGLGGLFALKRRR